MSLLDGPSDLTPSLESTVKGRFESKAPFAAFVDGENEEDHSSARKEKGKPRHADVDTQKNTFSLRRRHKEKDREVGWEGKAGKKVKHTRNKSYSHSPPDSPKLKHQETSRKVSRNPAASPRSHRKEYAHLLENDFSSGEDEEDFLLSKGHVAREKRAGTNAGLGSKTPPREVPPSAKTASVVNLSFMTSPSHSTTLDSKASFASTLPPTVGPSSVQAFPVQFVATSEAPLTDDMPASPNRPALAASGFFSFDSTFSSPVVYPHSPPVSTQQTVVPLLPPPPSTTSVGSSTPSTSVSTSSASSGMVSLQPSATALSSVGPSQVSPFLEQQQQIEAPLGAQPPPSPDWSISEELHQKCVEQFKQIQSEEGLLSGEKARNFFIQSKLPVDELSKIWKLSDMDKDGSLSVEEFIVAMKVVMMRRRNHEIPTTLPEELKLAIRKTPKESPSPRFKFAFPPPPGKASKSQEPSAKQRQSQSRPLSQTESSSKTAPSTITLASPEIDQQPETQFPATSLSMGFETELDEVAPVQHVMADHHLYALVDIGNKNKKPPEANKSSIQDDSFASDITWTTSGEDTELLTGNRQVADPLFSLIPEVQDPAVARLVSIDDSSCTEDNDDISGLMDEPKDRTNKKKTPKHSPHNRSQHLKSAPPRPPPPYQGQSKKSVSPPPLSSDDDSLSPHNASPSQSLDSDTQLMISTSRPAPPKPAPPKIRPKPAWMIKASTEQQLPTVRAGEDSPDGLFNFSLFKGQESRRKEFGSEQEKTHNRSTSWDLTKMMREEHAMAVHEDLPSAEPPKPPPRRPLHSVTEDGFFPLQRSASTGSLASIGTPAVLQKSRSPSTGSGSLVAAMELSQVDNLLPIKARRPAPAPPPTKPRFKKPLLPPTLKKLETEVAVGSDSDDRPLLTDSYQKKNKKELLQAISVLKEDNNLYSCMNEELNEKLNELIKQKTQLELQLQRQSSSSSLLD